MNWNTLILQATNEDDIYSIFPLISILAYADLLFESAKGIGNFSVICDVFIRLFVKISFGCLLQYRSASCRKSLYRCVLRVTLWSFVLRGERNVRMRRVAHADIFFCCFRQNIPNVLSQSLAARSATFCLVSSVFCSSILAVTTPMFSALQ